MFTAFGRRLLPALAVSAALLVGAGAVQAQGAPKLPVPVIAVIDVQQLLHEAAAAQAVRSQRDKLAQSYQDEISKEESSLRETDQELARQRNLLSPEVFGEKVQAFERRLSEFQLKVQNRRRAIEEGYGNAMEAIHGALIRVTDELAEEVGANLVLPKNQVFLHDNAMDITAAALERLNKRLPTVEFKVPKLAEPVQAPAKAPKK